MATKWLSAAVPSGTATHESGKTPAVISQSDGPSASAALTSFDTAMAQFVTAFGVVTYSATTHQFSSTFSTTVSGTSGNGNTLVTDLNAALALLKSTVAIEAPSGGVIFAYDGSLSKNAVKDALRQLIASLGN